ncbi:MAG: hypothetical protein ACR2HX_15000 [Pyrinomonadaceae bacterium]
MQERISEPGAVENGFATAKDFIGENAFSYEARPGRYRSRF